MNSVHCCRWWSAPLPVPEASILFSFSSLFFVFFASAIRYARLLCGGWRAPAFDLYLSAIGLDSVAHVLYWSVGESRQWYLFDSHDLLKVQVVWSLSSLVCWAVISSPPLGVLVGFLFFFSVMIGIDVFLSGEMCREQLISWSLPSLWSLRLLAPSLSWMLALSFLLYGFGNCYVSGCALSLVSFYCRSSVKLECREASELYIRFSNTAAIKIFVSLWCSIGSRFFCGPLPLDRIIPVPLFWSLDHDMLRSFLFACRIVDLSIVIVAISCPVVLALVVFVMSGWIARTLFGSWIRMF
ncbi:LOW QUALITY PROTEIN: hypothetical protein HID58_025989 [Brassica napus]|uniref:Uncharacterized protein n=1 Tax=Brassica napus TaxID=3708 RepID=A0ABQ8CMP4_BRANA|nr:LOW QUALITY PROTEIN: hypothetical protein HID58_025989 [Brassica napus]